MTACQWSSRKWHTHCSITLQLTPPHFVPVQRQVLYIQSHVMFFMLSGFSWWDEIVHFVDIGGIDHRRYLSFLFVTINRWYTWIAHSSFLLLFSVTFIFHWCERLLFCFDVCVWVFVWFVLFCVSVVFSFFFLYFFLYFLLLLARIRVGRLFNSQLGLLFFLLSFCVLCQCRLHPWIFHSWFFVSVLCNVYYRLIWDARA
jgi:hypothetical protein